MRRIVAGGLLVLCVFILTAALAYASDGKGRIVFTKSVFTREGFNEDILKSFSKRGWWELYQRDVCVINSDGTESKQLTDDGVSYHAKWSPDGTKIAFCSGPPPMVSLLVMEPDGSNKIELVSKQENIYGFRWSPDGTKILVYVKTKSPRTPEEAWIVGVQDKSSVQRMGSSEWARGWNHWTPEGATIVNPNKRLIEGLPQGVTWPEWSQDGNYIAFIQDGRLAIADTNVVGMPDKWRPTKIEPPCERIGDWSWSPDGKKFLFFAGGNVCSINFDGKEAINLSMCRADNACWSPDGSQVAFTTTDGRKKNTEIYIVNSDGTGHIQLTNTNYFHMDLDWR